VLDSWGFVSVGYFGPEIQNTSIGHGSDEQKVCRELTKRVAGEIAEPQPSKRPLPKKSALVTVPVTV